MNSRHLIHNADATDITWDGFSDKYHDIIRDIFSGVGYYPEKKFYHVDSRPNSTAYWTG
jgi:uncharacterized protein YcbK (DUF882 family)